MKESTLFKFALAVSLIGILALLIIVEKIELPLTNINSAKDTKDENLIKVKGTIENVKEETGNINVIVFKENNLNFTKNSLVEIEGKVQEYQGKNEVIAKRIIT